MSYLTWKWKLGFLVFRFYTKNTYWILTVGFLCKIACWNSFTQMSAKSYQLNAAEFSYCNWNHVKGRYSTSIVCKLQTHLHSRREVAVSRKDQINCLSFLYCISVNKICTDVECILTSQIHNLKSETSRTILERLLNLNNPLLL